MVPEKKWKIYVEKKKLKCNFDNKSKNDSWYETGEKTSEKWEGNVEGDIIIISGYKSKIIAENVG